MLESILDDDKDMARFFPTPPPFWVLVLAVQI